MTKKWDLSLTKAILKKDSNDLEFGYYSSFNKDSSNIAIIEAFERFLYGSIFVGSEKEKFVKDELIDIITIDHDRPHWQDKNLLINDTYKDSYRLGYRFNDNEIVAINNILVCGNRDFYPLTNSGTACHISKINSLNNAIFESLERDVLLRNWIKQNPPLEIKDCSTAYFHRISNIVAEYSFQLNIYTYTTDIGIHVCIATLTNKIKESPYFFIGAGSSFKIDEAIDKSIRECFTIWAFDYFAIKHNLIFEYSSADQSKHYYEYNNFKKIDKMFLSCDSVNRKELNDISDIESAFSNIIEYYDFIAFPIDNDIADCVHVWSPKVLPLYFGDSPKIFPKHKLGSDSFEKEIPIHPY